jgi:hypothetical protein
MISIQVILLYIYIYSVFFFFVISVDDLAGLKGNSAAETHVEAEYKVRSSSLFIYFIFLLSNL